MKTRSIVTIIAVLAALIILSSSLYVVTETEQVVITQFGDPVGNPIITPGLKFKVPFIQTANFFDKRFLEWDGEANQVPTKDKRYLWVDTYARWRIVDPLKFFQRLQNEIGAQSRLDDIIDGETRSSVARHDLVEMVRSTNRDPEAILVGSEEETAILEEIEKGRDGIVREILERASSRVQDLGIELIDVRFKRINYVEEVQKDVFARMIAERRRIAERFRSEGEGESARIRGERERELKRIQSEAYREAQEIRGKADGEATRIYAEAYNRDASFYTFMKSLETYEKTVDPQTTFILTTDSDLLRFMKDAP
ncbi:MAG: protease modulator HflC [Acidobacteria bacterium]|nr:protease modulator HflC [Acidobacteriota bacterium]